MPQHERPLSEYMYGDLLYIYRHKIHVDDLRGYNQQQIHWLLHRKYITKNDKGILVLTHIGDEVLHKYLYAKPRERSEASQGNDLSETVKKLLKTYRIIQITARSKAS